jgi:hypothetical protein
MHPSEANFDPSAWEGTVLKKHFFELIIRPENRSGRVYRSASHCSVTNANSFQ